MGIQRLKPVSSGTDFDKYTPKTSVNNSNSTSWSPTLIVSGKGILIGVAQRMRSGYTDSHIRINIDGVVVFDSSVTDIPFTRLSKYDNGNSIPFMHPFKNSLVVEHKLSSGDGSDAVNTIVSYLLE